MKKQIMSIAAIAAIFTTGVSAFDATAGEGILMKETGVKTAVAGTYSGAAGKISVLPAAITPADPGQLGDALIYPAFFGGNSFSSEFSVINTSSTKAVIAKVVLYSAKDSKELRDFNIYLSKNDVFRATIKDGKITSTDGSTVVVGSDSFQTVTDHTYKYTDSSTMASDATPFETTVTEDIGYIAVFAMAESTGNNGYHKKHNELWRDYRHLLDQCRTENWRGGITEGIYTGAAVTVPNILASSPAVATAGNGGTCGALSDTVATPVTTPATAPVITTFTGPTPLLTGSMTVSGSDSKGTRSMVIKPTPFTNYTDAAADLMLWTEGELASIADRCIEFTGATNSKANYDNTCIDADAATLAINNTLYEFGSLESALAVTQPWKRTAIQMNGDGTTMTTAAAWTGVTRHNVPADANGLALTSGDNVDYNVISYGEFKIQATVYNDDEDNYVATAGGFTVSPATTATADGIPNEMSLFNPIPGGANYPKGYAMVSYAPATNMHGIVTQMTANEIDGTAEINWLYPFTN